MSIQNYLDEVNKHFQSGHATEHTYRGDFAELLKCLITDVHVTNEPSNVTDCGNPDYVLTRKEIPIGFIEAKDIGKNLDGKEHKEQFTRYRKALDNLIITDYIKFQFFQKGEKAHEIEIARAEGKAIIPLTENFEKFTNLIKDFAQYVAQTIKSPKTLAEMMAAKARLLENILYNALTADEDKHDNTELQSHYETFKDILIHDLTPQGFADIYAQTLAYGMFAARLHDKTLDTFCRREAGELIPKSNPFLRKLFNYIAGADIDERIVVTVDNLADVFRATNVEALLKNFGKATQTQDPIIHFYETFLAEYDPKLRKARGVWYTPEPVVKFIVRGVDEILKTEFHLKDGLADTTKTTIEVEAQGTAVTKGKAKGKRLTVKKEVHKVQVLDPATGTGTFLAEVIKFIYGQKFKAMQGIWSSYVEEHLIPRLNGFELLMASYSMAHLKLDMLLAETGYQPKKNPRLNVFLTNSLEESYRDTGTLFANWLSAEANEANNVKKDTPVMVVIGNPPYSVSSSNKSEWIEKLMEDYKTGLNEQNIQPLSDDYIKFIRFGQFFIDRNNEGILAYISNNSFTDGLIHRRMRQALSETFDDIYILDLHGNSKKKEKDKLGKADQNVFDIMQGVSISFFVKKSETKTPDRAARLFKADILGSRKEKYDYLEKNTISTIKWEQIELSKPDYFYFKQNTETKELYEKGFCLSELFINYSNGFTTERDAIALHFEDQSLSKILNDIESLDADEFRRKYEVKKDGRDWKLENAKNDVSEGSGTICSVLYRPFDFRRTYYSGKTKGFHAFPRGEVLKHLNEKNIAIISPKQKSENGAAFISNCISGHKSFSAYNKNTIFPLYLYPSNKTDLHAEISEGGKEPNLNTTILKRLSSNLNLQFKFNEPEDTNSFNEVQLLDYIYAICHAPNYLATFQEFLALGFPKIPYPKNKTAFKKLSKLGSKLRALHLMECPSLEDAISTYPQAGNNDITNKINKKDWEIYDTENQLGRIRINSEQYFEGIPVKVWEFYIGGYQPAQKWLKDRVGRTLNIDDIQHYQKIIVALHETDRIMQKIDKIDFL